MSLDKLGKDEWVSQVEGGERTGSSRVQNPLLAALLNAWAQIPRPLQFVILAVIPLLLPLLRNDYITHTAGLVWLYAVLAVGLNVVVGYTGMLDLGYIAFFGIGGYAYAMLSSPHFNVHLPTWISLPLVTLLTIIVGFILGLPSLRLHGDYLAIVTLGFGQIFVQLTTAMNRVFLPWLAQPINLTGGPNGIPGIDRLAFLGLRAETETAYYYILLATLALVLLFVYRLNHSRLGRAWRSIREDALASEAMGIPTDRLRLLAFATGAGIAGFAGAIFAAWQQSVFPQNFDVALLITLYAMVVLGGVGSLPGMVVGSLVITVLPELLRPGTAIGGVELSQLLFYGGLLAFLAIFLRSRLKFALIVGAVIILGIAIRLLAFAIAPDAIAIPTTGSALSKIIQSWLVIPLNVPNATNLGNIAFFAVVGLLVALTRLPRNMRNTLLVFALYLLAFVWETRLSKEPSTARLLLTGVLLVMLMNYRPQGLFGQRRVEIA